MAVLDFGKTNSKPFVFGQDGRILDERRPQPIWRNLWTDNMALAKHARTFIGLGLETVRRKAELVSAWHKP